LLAGVGGLAFTAAAHAAPLLNGSFGVVVDPFTSSSASYTTSSLTLNSQNLITTAESGDFSTVLPSHSDLTAYSSAVGGLSTSPTSESISDYFLFSSPDSTLATSGTTPTDRFSFALSSLTEVNDNGSLGATFTGTGTITDSAGAYAATPAEFTVGFSSTDNYSFTLATVPEPTTLALIGLPLGALMLRRRKQ
jgi:hypothetical protein